MKYIKCDHCGKRINFGETILHYDYCAVYCSDECYASETAYFGKVDEDLVYDTGCAVYDDEET